MNLEPAGRAPATNTLAPNVVNDIFERLWELDRACGPKANRHDRATVLICACIDGGIDTSPHIIGTLKHMGFNPRHIGKLLHDGTGNAPSRHFWYRDEAGAYLNYPQSAMAVPMNG